MALRAVDRRLGLLPALDDVRVLADFSETHY